MHKIFSAAFEASADIQRLLKTVREGVTPCSVFGVSDASKPLMAALCADKRVLYITSSPEKAQKAAADIESYTGQRCVYIGAQEQQLGASSQSHEQTHAVISALREVQNGAWAAADAAALTGFFMPPEEFASAVLVITKGQELPPERLAASLVRMGYVRAETAEAQGQFAQHGGITDIFPVGSDSPLRVEFFDTEIESLRVIDPATQRSVSRLDSAQLLPARLFCPTQRQAAEAGEAMKASVRAAVRRLAGTPEASARAEGFSEAAQSIARGDVSAFEDRFSCFLQQKAGLLEYFGKDTLLVLDEPRRLRERCDNIHLEFSEGFKDLLTAGRALAAQGELVRSGEAVFADILARQVLSLQGITTAGRDISPKAVFTVSGRNMQSFQNKVQLLAQELAGMKARGYTVLLCCSSKTRAKTLQNDLAGYSVHISYTEDTDSALPKGSACALPVRISSGFEYPELKIAFISEADIYASLRHRTIRRAKRRDGIAIDSFTELNVGDYVVHENNGIGVYQGLEKIVTDGVARDYIKIAYAGQDRLYVPIEQLRCVQKYVGPGEDTVPKLSKLGTKEWQNAKARAKKSIEDIADQLIEIYRKRENAKGYAFSPDTPWQRQFEDDFPYTETADQITCIDEIKADMERPRVMDRLLCGDVGYGKTEVALRAAFKAVMDGKQVAILAPTTILALQHYNTVLNRTEPYSVRCEMLSGFRTAAEKSRIKKQLLEGKIDIIVGTHALLAKSVQYKDLGLLIIDEEQRFGVKHKEYIKQLKTNVDVLTLSATPIPRTLHMSLVGIRDMSVLSTPPQERYPVQTYVAEYNSVMIREALTRELSRGGQVYVVSNRVQGIERVAQEIQALAPSARIAVGHGQMEQGELEQVMLDFYNGQYDILLCTTIIESGLDVPNVNTMIVLDADSFGLSQLYQLRGRVGRSNRVAYAYFTFRRGRVLSETAEKRLNALREFTEFGSGFKIAMRDLEIRGAGNLLGGEQSGHMQKIGYELYCKLIRQAVSGQTEERPEVKCELKIGAYIEDKYIPSELQKLAVYKRISEIDSAADRDELLEELADRYGKPPESVRMLAEVAYMRALASKAGVERIRQKEDAVIMSFASGYSLDFARVTAAVNAFAPKAALSAGANLAIVLRVKGMTDADITALAVSVLEKINE